MQTIDKIGRLLWWAIQNWRTITFAKVKNFFQAKYRQQTASATDTEQFLWRATQVAEKSPECVLSGKCVHCGCETPDKFHEEDACEQGCYPKWMKPKEWEEFKKTI